MATVGIYLGTHNDSTGNIQRVLTAWGSYLADTHDLEAFGSAQLPEAAAPFYSRFRTRNRTSHVAFDKVLVSYLDCREYIRSRSPDIVVQVWKYKTHGPGVALAGSRHSIPVITRLSGDAFNEYRQVDGPKRYGIYLLASAFGRLPIRYSNRIITLGPYERDLLLQRGADGDDIVTLPPPLADEGRFTPPTDRDAIRTDLDLPTDRPIALYVGRLTTQKGMEFLREVIDGITAESDYQFVLVGDGPYAEVFSNGYTPGSVRVEGRVPYEEIHRYYQSADVFLHPSPFEGIPLVLIEALECGLPVVARDVGDNAFITNNVVESSGEMISMVLNGEADATFRNREFFTDTYQRRTLLTAIDDSLAESRSYTTS